MSVSRKVLRKMKKVMGVIGASASLIPMSSQVSCAAVNVGFDPCNKILYFSGNGVIDISWRERYSPESIKSVVIEDGIKEISDSAFCFCKSLEKITIPNSVTSIGEDAFRGCKSLTEITIPNSVNVINDSTFWDCESLKKVIIPNSVTSIGENAFGGCSSLTEITIPNSVNIIYDGAFWCCKRLGTVKFEDMSRRDSNSCWDVWLRKNAFGGCTQLIILDLGNDTNSRNAKVESGAFFKCDKNFRALEGNTVRGKFYSTVLS